MLRPIGRIGSHGGLRIHEVTFFDSQQPPIESPAHRLPRARDNLIQSAIINDYSGCAKLSLSLSLLSRGTEERASLPAAWSSIVNKK